MRAVVVVSGGVLAEVAVDEEARGLVVTLFDFDNLDAEGILEADLEAGVCPADVDSDTFSGWLEAYRFWKCGDVVY